MENYIMVCYNSTNQFDIYGSIQGEPIYIWSWRVCQVLALADAKLSSLLTSVMPIIISLYVI